MAKQEETKKRELEEYFMKILSSMNELNNAISFGGNHKKKAEEVKEKVEEFLKNC